MVNLSAKGAPVLIAARAMELPTELQFKCTALHGGKGLCGIEAIESWIPFTLAYHLSAGLPGYKVSGQIEMSDCVANLS